MHVMDSKRAGDHTSIEAIIYKFILWFLYPSLLIKTSQSRRHHDPIATTATTAAGVITLQLLPARVRHLRWWWWVPPTVYHLVPLNLVVNVFPRFLARAVPASLLHDLCVNKYRVLLRV